MWLAIDIAHRDLAFGIRPQERQATVFAQLGLAFDQAVGVINRCGHEFSGLAAGEAKHQALVAGAGVQVVVAGVINALGDVVALLVVGHQHGAAFVVNTVVCVVVTNALDGVARHLDVVDMRVGGDLAGQHDEAGVGQRLCGDAGQRVLFENCVENSV